MELSFVKRLPMLAYYVKTLPSLIYEAFIHDMLRIFRVLPKKLKTRLFSIFGIQFLYSLLETSTVLVISFFVLALTSADQARNKLVINLLLTIVPQLKPLVDDPRNFIAFACVLVVIFVAVKNLVSFWAFSRTTRFAEDVSFHVCQETIWRYLNKNYFWHISPISSSILERLEQRTSLTTLLISLLMLYSYALCCLALFTSLFIAIPKLTLIIVIVFGLACSTTYLLLRRRIDRSGAIALESANMFIKAMSGATRGIREVLIYRQQRIFYETISESIQNGVPARSFLAFAGQLPSWILEVAGFSTICAVTIYMISSGMPMADVVVSASMLMLTSWRVLPAVTRVLSFSVTIRGTRPSALHGLELLETFVSEKIEPVPEPDPNFEFTKSLELNNVSFRYPAGQVDSLEGISFKLRKGHSLGLIGASGSGKSTLALLLSGLVSPKSGQMLIDGQELSPAGQVAYTQRVGFVAQHPLLMPGSVADNVAFSQWGQQYDRQQVEEACRRAAMDFVFQNPDGIDLKLGTGGEGLSGGQAQRVAIARALFTNPEIIIFDEATSALDQASENIIKNTIEHLNGEISSIIIAHRLSTVENCNLLLWLENGRVKALGTPKEILPIYKNYMDSVLPCMANPLQGEIVPGRHD